jgi:hypothetical protein
LTDQQEKREATSRGTAMSDHQEQLHEDVERLSMVSERQGWTFGETLEYALDALELAMAKTARIPSDPLRPRPPRR